MFLLHLVLGMQIISSLTTMQTGLINHFNIFHWFNASLGESLLLGEDKVICIPGLEQHFSCF